MMFLKVLLNMVVGNVVMRLGVYGVCKLINIVCVFFNDVIGDVFCNIKFGI